MESKFQALLSLPQSILTATDKVGNYKKYCLSKQSECDRALTDIDHLIELTKLDAVKMVRATVKRKEILIERRFYKDEAERCDILLQTMPQVQQLHDQLKSTSNKLVDYAGKIESREYTPRVLFDIFDYDEDTLKDKQGHRQALTKFGKHASKQTLQLDQKFKEIEVKK